MPCPPRADPHGENLRVAAGWGGVRGTGHNALCSEISCRFTQYLPLLWKYYQCPPSFIRGIKLKIRKLRCEIIKYATHSCACGRKPPTCDTKIHEERKSQSRSQRRRPNGAHSPHRGSHRTSGDLREVTLSLGLAQWWPGLSQLWSPQIPSYKFHLLLD